MKKCELYLNVMNAALVSTSGTVVVKIKEKAGDKMIGLQFVNSNSVDSLITALKRIKKSMEVVGH